MHYPSSSHLLELFLLHGSAYANNSSHLCAALLEIHKTYLMPTESEFKTLEKFVLIVKPLVDIPEAIGAEKWVTISMMRPFLTKLLETHFVATANDSSLVKIIKKIMLDD